MPDFAVADKLFGLRVVDASLIDDLLLVAERRKFDQIIDRLAQYFLVSKGRNNCRS